MTELYGKNITFKDCSIPVRRILAFIFGSVEELYKVENTFTLIKIVSTVESQECFREQRLL